MAAAKPDKYVKHHSAFYTSNCTLFLHLINLHRLRLPSREILGVAMALRFHAEVVSTRELLRMRFTLNFYQMQIYIKVIHHKVSCTEKKGAMNHQECRKIQHVQLTGWYIYAPNLNIHWACMMRTSFTDTFSTRPSCARELMWLSQSDL